MLGRSEPLHRLESYDISHIAGTDIVASMVVFCDGAPSKKDYKRFKLEEHAGQGRLRLDAAGAHAAAAAFCGG